MPEETVMQAHTSGGNITRMMSSGPRRDLHAGGNLLQGNMSQNSNQQFTINPVANTI